MTFCARHAQVMCCSEEALRLGGMLGLKVEGAWLPSGTRAEAGQLLLTLVGRAAGAGILVSSVPYTAPPRDAAVRLEPVSVVSVRS